MRFRINLLFWLLIFYQIGLAQVTTNPTLPIENQLVTITFDATQGTAGLKDYTGDVYAHTGVITDKSTSATDWKYVIAAWTTNIPKAKLTRVTPNTYTLEITPDIRSFYGVPTGEIIKQMAFVFRSADQSKEGKATGGKDILVDVFSSGLNVSITNPSTNSILPLGAVLPFSASSTVSADLRLYLNNSQVKAVTGTQLDYTFSFSQSGDYWMKISASNGITTVYDSVFVNILGNQVVQTLPAGAKKGINYIDSQTARLVLWAPYKSYVYAIGEFNNWLPSSTSRMKRDGDYFWIDIQNLTPGKEYPFQYFVDGQLKIADPYTEKTCDPNNDKYITSTTYPGLISYPTGKTDGIASILQTNQVAYVWQKSTFTPATADTMVIYECLVRDFDEKHSYSGVIDHLDYLKELGTNVLELMPVNEFEGNSSWGYNPSFYFAPDKYYGPMNELKRLVDECHKRGISTVIDLVLNHSYGQSPFVQLYFDGSKPTAQNPWYNVQSNFTNPAAQWGYDFNHDSPATRELVDSISSFWMSEYKIDGFRFDFTKGFSNNIKDASDTWGSKYDAQRIANLERMADQIWKRKSGAIVIFEHLADNSEETELANFKKGILLWGNMNYNATQAAMGFNSNSTSDLSWASYVNRGWSKPSLVGYMESHDEERMVYKCLNFGNSLGSYNIKDQTVALSRAALTSALFFPIPGPKMIWQFGELGYDISIDFNGRLGEKPLHWEYKSVADRALLFQVFSKLFYLKKKYPIFSTTNFSQSLNGEIKWIKLNLNGENGLIVGNFGLSTLNAQLDFQKTGTWYDYFGQKSISVAATSQSILLGPGEYKLFSTQNFGVPLFTGIEKEFKDNNDLLIYPNPATDYINVTSVEKTQNVSIFTLAGTKAKEFKLSNIQGVENQLYIGDLYSGIYLLQTKNADGQIVVRKIIKRP
ncbi:MAG: alpha-amylase family glycosyl hydrolase [Bacteroidia bacterium]|nr:alpha-amylase family glycosyl hydrolase [Bacteroidia bacterium]